MITAIKSHSHTSFFVLLSFEVKKKKEKCQVSKKLSFWKTQSNRFTVECYIANADLMASYRREKCAVYIVIISMAWN